MEEEDEHHDEDEVDLDSLLRSSSSDDDDDAITPRHHRTVDEILLTHSSPPPSPPSSSQPLTHTHSGSISRASSSTEFGPISNPGRGWFGVRSYGKPGAALAAAAAASRSTPSRAEAIKYRRMRDSATSSVFSSVSDDRGSLLDGEVVNRSSNEGVDEFGLQASDAIDRDSVGTDSFEVDGIEGESGSVSGKVLADEVVIRNDDLSKSSSSSEHHYHDGEVSLGLDANPPIGNTMEFRANDNFEEMEDDGLSFIEDDVARKEVRLESSEILDEVKMSDEEISESVGESSEVEEVLATQSEDKEDGDVGEDENNSPSDVVDMVAELTLQWESRRGMKMSRKRCESSLELLELAEEFEKKQAFTGLHWEAGAAALPMRLEGVRRGPDVLGYFDVDTHNFITQTIASETFRRDHGSPQVLAVHFNYIAIGMSRGVVVVVSSKYTPHHADKMDTKILILGLQGNRAYAPVTAMCFNQQGDLLFAGYADGHYTVWDVPRASALKLINEHKAPVVHLLYLGQNNVVSGDSKGIVKLIHFSVVPLLNRISYSAPTKLLDESTSTVVCAVPLISSEVQSGSSMPSQGSNAVSTGSISSMMGGVVGGDSGWKLFDGYSTVEEGVVIFVTHQSALVAKLNPSIEVYAQLPRPAGLRDGAMPYAAWKYIVVSGEVSAETSDRVALLAIAWDRTVQVAKLVKSELKVYVKWDLEAPAVGVFWLSDQLLVVLTSSGQMCLFSRDGDLIHQTSFAMDGSPSDDLISCHTYFTNKLGNQEKAHHNCVMVRGAKVYILGSKHLAVSRLLPWRERIEVLQRAGDWMGALYMAMTYYDGQAQAVIDLPRNLTDVQKTVMPYLLQLLFSYVDEVFSYITVACGKPDERTNSSVEHHDESNIEDSEAKEQYSRVGGVAVEFCLHINRTDILFDEIYSRFGKVKHQETFLELLEPYILKDMLGSLPPEIMQALVEHYSQRGWLQRVEQCVLHMDILSLDFNQVVRLCREHRLHGALIYLFNKGLDDFKTPLEELLIVLQNSLIESVPALGYRILIYLKYCFQGLAFPPGHGNIPPVRLPSLRNELVQYLLESSNTRSSWSVSNISSDEVFRNLHHLLEFDTGSTLEVLKFAFKEDETLGTNDLSQDLIISDGSLTEGEDDFISQSNDLVQKLVDVLSDILGMSQTSDSTECDTSKSIEIWPSKNDVKHVFGFIAYFVACKRAKVQKAILNKIVEYMTSDINSSSVVQQQNPAVSKRREIQLLALLEAIPVAEWDTPYFLHLCGKAEFHQACGLINAIGHHYSAALDCYMNVVEEPIHAFSFIHDMLQKLGDSESRNIESAVTSRIHHLVRLSREGTFFMVLYHFPAKTQQILTELHSHPECQLLYLKTVFEVHSNVNLDFSHLKKFEILDLPGGKGARLQSDKIDAFLSGLLDFRKLVRSNTIQITDEITELYLELLCRYERDSVLKFLETFESYRVDHCLRLCQEFGIVDAAAFLLERVGDVGSALMLHISDLNHKFVMLGSTFDSETSDGDVTNVDTLMKKKEVHVILDTLHACIKLCQRNGPRLDPNEAEFLWFQLLDSVCEPLIADGQNNYYAKEPPVELLDFPLRALEGDGTGKAKWKVPISHKSAHTLRKLLSNFIKEIVEGMIGNVRLPEIMLKLLSENGTQEFGDFKPTILGMLGTYDFERRILDTAKCLIEDDTYYTMNLLKKGASHGYALDSLSCCLCNCLLTRNISGPGVRVYSCGHATHLHCELQDNGTSVSGSTGCPICIPKKRAQQSKSISGLLENGLVNISSTRAQHTNGTHAFHPHDYDAVENFQNSNQISRFELLHNLQKKDKALIQVENTPQLRLAPPSVYHEKVKKGADMVKGESSSVNSKKEKPTKGKSLKDVKVKKGPSIKFPLKTNIFGKEKVIKQR